MILKLVWIMYEDRGPTHKRGQKRQVQLQGGDWPPKKKKMMRATSKLHALWMGDLTRHDLINSNIKLIGPIIGYFYSGVCMWQTGSTEEFESSGLQEINHPIDWLKHLWKTLFKLFLIALKKMTTILNNKLKLISIVPLSFNNYK